MSDMRADWKSRIFALFGQCRKCTRTSMIAAVLAWAATPLAFVVFNHAYIGLATLLLAVALTALWIAHLMALSARGTLASMLRQFGATADEARAIVAALALPPRSSGLGGIRLQEGEAVSVQHEPRPDGAGVRLRQVVVSNTQGAIAAVRLRADGGYERAEPANVGGSTK